MGPPPILKDKTLIENVQKFDLRICAKQWYLGYNELLSNFAVPIRFNEFHNEIVLGKKECKKEFVCAKG